MPKHQRRPLSPRGCLRTRLGIGTVSQVSGRMINQGLPVTWPKDAAVSSRGC
jgi:hypothetical protein